MKYSLGLIILIAVTLIIMTAVGLALISGPWTQPLRSAGILPSPQLEVTYIDVGYLGPDQPGVIGDSILLKSSEGKVALIDGGYPNGLALAYLKAHNITHIDLMILTHPHDDHDGGLIDVLKTIPVDLLVTNGQTLNDSSIYVDFEKAVEDSGIQTRIVKSREKIAFGSLSFQVLSPRKIDPDTVNGNSIVMRLADGKVSFLFTGDTQLLEETRLVNSGAPLQSTILKIAHHGADTSSSPDFLMAVAPSVAIYSAGTGNMYEFPHAITLKNLHDLGVPVYGTDLNGTIAVHTDGKTFEVIPERGKSL
jgi:competence protein ComEC